MLSRASSKACFEPFDVIKRTGSFIVSFTGRYLNREVIDISFRSLLSKTCGCFLVQATVRVYCFKVTYLVDVVIGFGEVLGNFGPGNEW